jgi:hypothetical protein
VLVQCPTLIRCSMNVNWKDDYMKEYKFPHCALTLGSLISRFMDWAAVQVGISVTDVSRFIQLECLEKYQPSKHSTSQKEDSMLSVKQ